LESQFKIQHSKFKITFVVGDEMESHIAVFKSKEIRKTIHNNEWWFSIVDVVEVLIDSVNTADYIKKMRNRDS